MINLVGGDGPAGRADPAAGLVHPAGQAGGLRGQLLQRQMPPVPVDQKIEKRGG